MLWISQHQRSWNLCLSRCLTSKVNSMSRTNRDDCKENRRCTHSNKCMTMHQRTPQKNPLMSIGLRAAAAAVIGYKVSHLRAPQQLIDVIELGFFCLSPQYQVTLFFYFFLIKSQHWCYLTLIWSQLNPCLNLWQRGPHSNSLSVQPLTPLRLLSWLWVHWSKSLATFWSCDQRIFATDQVNKVIRWKFNHTGFITDVHRPEI